MIVLPLRRDLLLFCFDPQHARSIGLPVALLHYGLLILLSLTIVASLKAVGIILVVAMLVTPGCIAHLLTNRFDRMLLIALAVAIGSCVVGTLVSFHIDGSTGPCIVLVQAAAFLLALLFAPAAASCGVRGLRRPGMVPPPRPCHRTAAREAVAGPGAACTPRGSGGHRHAAKKAQTAAQNVPPRVAGRGNGKLLACMVNIG